MRRRADGLGSSTGVVDGGPQNWGQSPIRGCACGKFDAAMPNWDPTPNLLPLAVY